MDCRQCGKELPEGAAFCGECGTPVGGAEAAQGMMTIGGLQTEMPQDTANRAASRQAELEPGAVFADRFTIKSLIGRGGMGVVYAAEDRVTEGMVALKLIRRDRLTGPDAVRKLVREGVTTRDIRHPNVVSVYDVGDADGQPYLSMELLTGQSLRQWIRETARAREDVPYPVAVRIIREVLEGLKAAHAKGVIHRDLKPENIILQHLPSAEAAPLRVADFGIAQAMGANYETGATGALGTREYMAPEQITNPDAATEAADLYSLSVIFYELLVGVLPQGHWQPPSGGREDVPDHIDKLIERGLSNRPLSRPQSADEYLAALEPKQTRPAPPPPRPGPDPGADPAPSPAPAPAPAAGGGWQALMQSKKFKIGAAIVIGIGVIGAALDEFGTSGVGVTPSGVVFDNSNSGGGSGYQSFNGFWILEFQGATGPDTAEFKMSIDGSGRVTGNGYTPETGNVRVSGAFDGTYLSLTDGAMNFAGQFDGGCHINLPGVGTFHINHFPNEPCP